MSTHDSFTEPLRRIADITPEELERYLSAARRQRAEAFAAIFAALGRVLTRPFRRRPQVAEPAGHYATKVR